ncbi:protein MAINTENANCE OF PSII UNDER HIGH LIGHT 1 [Mercurialis annua]|uniref:protein MAINTENANCE OF PSII UNDER HIGH LIGHT 1 n=1 Tax=Mercurialis annua TaxID=3986 RepID=UPI00215FEACC|nr:protein MAINTENANCE OF PSII UNDER HIGH LIGHT 1 [Mercurialis annua]
MACASQAMNMISANTCSFTSPRLLKKYQSFNRRSLKLFTVRADSDDADCNDEECAPDKEVGRVSMEWLAGEKTKVAGTFPPRTRGWTGYVEKDTAGQTNIYSVEPVVYIAESAISSGTAGTSSDGSENAAAVSAGIGLLCIAAASLILFLVGRAPTPPIQTAEYSGPSLSYYVNKFKPAEIVQAAEPTPVESSPSVELPPEISAPEVSETQVQPESQPESTISSENIVS